MVVETGIIDVEGGNGYSYGLERSKQYGVPIKSVPSSSFGLESLGGMEIGTGMEIGIDLDGILVITTYTEWLPSLPPPYGCRVSGLRRALNRNEPNRKVEQFGLRTGVD